MDEQYLENIYFDLANKFDKWYQANSQEIGGYNEPVSISDILRKYGKIRTDGNYNFFYDDITIFIDVEGQHDGSSPHYAAFVYHTNHQPKLWIDIEFTKDGWVYSHDTSTHYKYNRDGMVYSQDNDNKMKKWFHAKMQAEAAVPKTRSGLPYGLPYGYNRGGRKSRKSRKSRKNKKQKNRKTNRR